MDVVLEKGHGKDGSPPTLTSITTGPITTGAKARVGST